MLIDSSYFIRTIHVAQKNQAAVSENLESYIGAKVPYILKRFLGDRLFEDFKAGLDEQQPEDKWLRLKNLLVNEVSKESPLANYVFVTLLEDEVLFNSGIGVVLTLGENSTKASPVDKIVRAWNEMILMFDRIHHLIKEDLDSFYDDEGTYLYAHRSKLHIFDQCSCYCGCKPGFFNMRNTLGI